MTKVLVPYYSPGHDRRRSALFIRGPSGVDEIKGGSPYGASTITNTDGSRQPSAVELEGARYQGRHVAEITGKLISNG